MMKMIKLKTITHTDRGLELMFSADYGIGVRYYADLIGNYQEWVDNEWDLNRLLEGANWRAIEALELDLVRQHTYPDWARDSEGDAVSTGSNCADGLVVQMDWDKETFTCETKA